MYNVARYNRRQSTTVTVSGTPLTPPFSPRARAAGVAAPVAVGRTARGRTAA